MKLQPLQKFLRECFSYDRGKGKLYWKVRPAAHFSNAMRANNWNAQHAGKVAGWFHVPTGRQHIAINAVVYKAHLLIWVWHKGFWPVADLDHRDLNRQNDRIGNLREATRSQNLGNRRKQANNTSGRKGVHWSKVAQKWQAQIQTDGTYRYLGLFEDKESAARAYRVAAKKYFGEFARA